MPGEYIFVYSLSGLMRGDGIPGLAAMKKPRDHDDLAAKVVRKDVRATLLRVVQRVLLRCSPRRGYCTISRSDTCSPCSDRSTIL